MRTYFLAGLALLLATAFGAPPSNSPMAVTIEVGSAHTLGISGENGARITTRQPGNDAILVGLQIAEKLDHPCHMEMDWWRHNSSRPADASSQGTVETTLSLCSNLGYYSSVRVGSNGSQNVAYQYGDMFYAAHGIQVCLNRQGTRVKGVRLFGSTINQDDDGEVSRDVTLKDEFELPNCNTWKRARKCPSGEVMVGMKLHHNDVDDNANVDGYITGIAPMCAEVTVNTTASGGSRSN